MLSPYRPPTLADAVRTMARGLAYQECCVAIDARTEAIRGRPTEVLTHPLANAHHRVASRLCRIAREQFEEALLVGVDLSRAEVNAAVLRARGEQVAHAIECAGTLIGIRDYLDEQVQFARDLRGDKDSPRSYEAVA